MSDNNNSLPPPKLPPSPRKLACLDLMPEEHITIAQGLNVAAERSPGPEADDYRRLSNLFRLMAIVTIFQEQMNDQDRLNAERDLAALGLNGIFVNA